MSYRIYKPQVVILPTETAVETYVANAVLEQVRQKPTTVLTLPTGSTPLGIYRLLVKAHKVQLIDFSQITTFNLDEYWPIKKSHHSSYTYYMNENLFDHVNIAEENINIPNGEAADVGVESKRYEKLIRKSKVDLGLISLGPEKTCHIAFNERGSRRNSRTRYVSLDEETRKANARFFDNKTDMPTGAITQGVADILDASRILFIATGKHKAWGVRRSLIGDISSDAPASFLRYHPHVTVVLDLAAASLLTLSYK